VTTEKARLRILGARAELSLLKLCRVTTEKARLRILGARAELSLLKLCRVTTEKAAKQNVQLKMCNELVSE
jgi:hypothetical protein